MGPGSSISVPMQKASPLNEMRLYGTPVLLVIAESGNCEVASQALHILAERGLDSSASAQQWAAAWRSTNSLRVQDPCFAKK
jgi:hypothetical protein